MTDCLSSATATAVSHSAKHISMKSLLASLAVSLALAFLVCPCGRTLADLYEKKSNPLSGSSSPFLPPPQKGEAGGGGGQCFCQLKGRIDDCLCSVDTVDYFNNMKIFPRLQSLLQKPFFRYFRYNPRKPCPFWDDASGKCANSNCGVRSCQREEVPPGLKAEVKGEEEKARDREKPHEKYTKEAQKEPCDNEEDDDNVDALNGKVDGTISEEDRANLDRWQRHDNSLQNFCDVDAEVCPDCEFVDLTINPERFTGYSGEAAHRIWRSIYEENCFKPPNSEGVKGAFSAAFLQVRSFPPKKIHLCMCENVRSYLIVITISFFYKKHCLVFKGHSWRHVP